MTKQGWVILLAGVGVVSAAQAEEDFGLPEAPDETDFSALRDTSPFKRVLSISDTYALRGVASLDDIQVATLYNRETKKTVVVTRDDTNEAGIQLVEVVPSNDLAGVAAKISFAGEEIELKYEDSQLSPEPRSKGKGASGGKGGKDSERKGPSKEDITRYKSMSEESRNKLRQYIGQIVKQYPDMPREERGNMIRGAMTRLADGRDITLAPKPEGGAAPKGGGDTGRR